MIRSSPLFAIASLALSTIAVADDIALNDGRVLVNATIIDVTPRKVTIKYEAGLTSVPKDFLPPELQARYPIDEAAARRAEQLAATARETALKTRAAEAERAAQSKIRREATAAATIAIAEKDVASEEAMRDTVISGALAHATRYFEEKYSWVPDTTPKCSATIYEAHPIEGWVGRWLVKGRASIRRYKNHELELNRLYADQPSERSSQEERIRKIRRLKSDYITEFVEFECTYSTDGSEPSFDIKLRT